MADRKFTPESEHAVKMAVDIRLATSRVKKGSLASGELDNLMSPGDVITSDPGFMR